MNTHTHLHRGKTSQHLCLCYRLDGLVVKASALTAEDPGFDSCSCCGDFSRLSHTSDLLSHTSDLLSHTSDLKIGTPVLWGFFQAESYQ